MWSPVVYTNDVTIVNLSWTFKKRDGTNSASTHDIQAQCSNGTYQTTHYTFLTSNIFKSNQGAEF